jgi:hypothetical protein
MRTNAERLDFISLFSLPHLFYFAPRYPFFSALPNKYKNANAGSRKIFFAPADD